MKYVKFFIFLPCVVLFCGCVKYSTLTNTPCIPSDSQKRIEGYIAEYNAQPQKSRGEFVIGEMEEKMRQIYIKANGECDKSALALYRTTLKYRGIPKNHRQEASLHAEVEYRLAERKGEFLP